MNVDDDVPIAVPVPVPVPVPMPTAPSLGIKQQQSSFMIATTHHGNNKLNAQQLDQLRSQGYTDGLSNEVLLFTKTYSLRFWIIDNSGSMVNPDGKRLVHTKSSSSPYKLVSCSRWKEIQETVDYHAQLAALLEAPTTFRLLNDPGSHIGPQEFSVAATGPELIHHDLEVARNTMARGSPIGVTPLVRNIKEIRQQIYDLAPTLLSQGRRVALVIATDGLPTNDYGIASRDANNEFTSALRTLEGLPVWIVIRLCTDEDQIVDFYNSIDSQLELSVEVLDDFFGEAIEIHSTNPWLNYTLPIHRMREMGIQNRLFDLLDERSFTRSELYDFCRIMFGAREFADIPDPEADFATFLKMLSKLVDKEKKQYNPVFKKVKPILDVKEIARIYGDSSCSIM